MAKHKLTKSKKQKAAVETVPGVQFEETPIDGATPAEVEEQAPVAVENSPEEGAAPAEVEEVAESAAEEASKAEKMTSEGETERSIVEEFDEALRDSQPRPEIDMEQKIEDGEPVKLIISINASVLDEDGWERFARAVKNKDQMFRHSFGAEELKIERNGDVVSLPWFTLSRANSYQEASAYCDFVSKLIIYARDSKRVLDLSENKPSDNEKFSMRVFMIRLNMKGDRYANARRILMHNLTGNSSFRYGDPRKRAKVVEEVQPETPTAEEEPATEKTEA